MRFPKFSYAIYLFGSVVLSPVSAFAVGYNFNLLEKEVKKIENEISAHIGVTVFDTHKNNVWSYKGDEIVPLTSTFKTIACAKLLSDSDRGKISLNSSVTINKESLVTYSPVTENYIGKVITFQTACSATMLTSDNTAANIVVNAVGGSSEITKFLRASGDNISRLDRFEPDLNESKPGDLRDTTTPNAISRTLNELLFGKTLSKSSQEQLKEWMVNNQVTDGLLRSILPEGWEIADRSGAGGFGSRSITAVVWSERYSPIIISIYIARTDASFEKRNKSILEIGQSIFNLYTQQTEG